MIPNKVNGDFVSYVLDTYDLSEEQREKLARTSLFRLRDDGITNFDEAYTYIDTLAMRAQSRHRARMRSLDENIGETKRTLHEIIGKEDDGIRRLFEEGQERKKLSGQEVIEYLFYCLDRQDIDVLSRLMEGQKVEFDVSLDYLLDNAEQIGERIRGVYERYEQDGVILLPRRQIVSVSFDPFEIEFGNHIGRKLTDEEKSVIVEAYRKFDGNAVAMARHLGYSPATVMKYCREVGLQFREGGGKLNSQKINLIISAHTLLDGNANNTAKKVGCSHSTVLRYWRREGLDINPNGGDWNRLSETEQSRIVSTYSEFRGRAGAVARHLGYSERTVIKYWREAGFKIDGKTKALQSGDISSIVSAHSEFNGNANRVAGHLGYSRNTVLRYWRKAGLEIRQKRNTS